MKLSRKNISYHLFVLLSLSAFQPVAAASIEDAITAVEDNDPATAIKIWTQLAENGNVIAEYNLANNYSSGTGTEKNTQLAQVWYSNASHKGLVDAYIALNKKALAPGNGVSINFDVGPQFWLSKQKPDYYTIQLASSRNKQSIKKLFNKSNLKGKGGYYQYSRNGIDRYALIYGSFSTVAEAKIAMSQLPEELRKKTPWVRKIKTLQNISK